MTINTETLEVKAEIERYNDVGTSSLEYGDLVLYLLTHTPFLRYLRYFDRRTDQKARRGLHLQDAPVRPAAVDFSEHR